MQAQVEAYRATPVGAHALKVYEHRSTASSPLDGERIPTAAKPPGAVGSIGATSVPGVVGAASVAGVVGADHKRDIGYHAFFGTGDPNLSVKRPFLNEPSPESVASTPPLWARKAAEDAPEPPTLRSLEAEVLAVVDGADAGAVLCANLPKLYYALHGAPLNCATYGEDRLSDLLGKLPNVYVRGAGPRGHAHGLLLAHARTAPVTAEPEKLRALAAEILALVDEAPGGKVLSANLPRAYFLKYRKPLDMKGYGALKMSRLLTALEPYGLESCGGATAGVGRAGSGVADDGPVADTIAPPPEDLASLRAELESMRGAGDAEELGRTVFVRGLPWTAEEAEPAVAKPPKQGKTIDPAGCDASPAELARLAAQILALCDAARSGACCSGTSGRLQEGLRRPMPSHGVKAKTLMALLPGVAVGGYDPSHVDPDNRWARASRDDGRWRRGAPPPAAARADGGRRRDAGPHGLLPGPALDRGGGRRAGGRRGGLRHAARRVFPGSERWVKVAKSERPCPPARRERASSNASRDDGAGAAAAAPPSARQPAPTAADAEELGRTVFVQGLPWAAEAEVRSWIARAGPIEFLAMPRDRTGRPSGYAFVVFRKLAGAEAACDTLHKECFPGSERWVKVAKSDRPCPEYGKRKGPSKWTPTPCTASPAELRALADQVLALCDAAKTGAVHLSNLPAAYEKAYGSKMPQHKLRMKPLLDLLPGVALGGYEPDHENPWAGACAKRGSTKKDAEAVCTATPAELQQLADEVLALCDAAPNGRVQQSSLGAEYRKAYPGKDFPPRHLARRAAAGETQVGVEAFKAKRAAKQRAKERAPRSGRETAARIQARTMRIRNLTPSGQPRGFGTAGADVALERNLWAFFARVKRDTMVERIHAMAASGTGYVAFTDAASMARVTGELQRSKIQILRDCDDVAYEGAPDLPPAMLADIQANNAMLDAMWRPGFGQS
ncbi:L-cystine transmembrane transporter [Aureococcus anophagefferens]|nr:L-cystine transmembrane transporter [Aureococcus anophagefferens]